MTDYTSELPMMEPRILENRQHDGVSGAFFSMENMIKVHVELQKIVKEETGATIDRQNMTDLQVIMRGVYIDQQVLHGGMSTDESLAVLNKMVLERVVPQVLLGVRAHRQYLKDSTTPHRPMARGTATSVKGTYSAELPVGVNNPFPLSSLR
jgi:hypothetical protein